MDIKINNEIYTLFVTEQFLKDGIQCEDTMPLDKWADMVRKKGISSLYEIESELSKLFGKEIKLTNDFPNVKRPIMNLTGCVGRLSSNLIVRKKEINSPDEGGFFGSEYNLEFGKLKNNSMEVD